MKGLVTGAILAAGIVLFSPPVSAEVPAAAGEWNRILTGHYFNLNDVFGGAANNFAVGANATFLHFDGADWVRIQVPATGVLHAVWGAPDGTGYAVGDAGTLLRFADGEVTREISGTWANLNGVWVAPAGDVFAVGDGGAIMHYTDEGAVREVSYTALRLNDVHGNFITGVFAVGDGGTIVHYDGEGWSLMPTPTTRNLNGVWAGPTEVIAVGDNGTVLRLVDGEWEYMATPTTRNLAGAWIESPTKAFAAGDYGMMLYFDGSEWVQMDSGTTRNLHSLVNGYAAGDAGVILQNVSIFREVGGLRITEVFPQRDQVEVTNTAGAFETAALPFSHEEDASSFIPAGEFLGAGEITVYDVRRLNSNDSDLWLYRGGPLDDPENLLHGVKYGPRADVGNTSTAVAANVWPSTGAFTAPPPSGMSIAWDGFGRDPLDWYVDETPTLGAPDFTVPNTVENELDTLDGVQDFENTQLGDEVFAIERWGYENESPAGAFAARFASDIHGYHVQRGDSDRWLRIRDEDGRDLDNVVHTAGVEWSLWEEYEWGFVINFEEVDFGGKDSPRMMLQHRGTGGYHDIWGVEYDRIGAWLVTTPASGELEREIIFRWDADTRPGQWREFTLFFNSILGIARVTADGNVIAVTLTSDLALDPGTVRLAYDGSGSENTATVLLDDIEVDFDLAPAVPLAVHRIGASEVSDGIELQWDVRATLSVDGFYVSRRVDGAAGMEQITGLLAPDTRAFTDRGAPETGTLAYVVTAVATDGTEAVSREALVLQRTLPPYTGGSAPLPIALRYGPNPFFTQTSITMSLPQGGDATLVVYDVRGRLVRRLARGAYAPGDHALSWDGRDRNGRVVAAGAYFFRLDAGGESLTRKVMLIR